MASRLLGSPRLRPVRWLVLGVLCSAASVCVVTGVSLLLPRGVPDGVLGALVVGGAGGLGAVVVLRARRGRGRVPR
ncbi:hypothetical protein [Streptomyces sp. NPDC015131]|uniref:hypothetical protein n=1 Tax=Streptomyces sp. NPDC015131 TaxID=3364941 RepID=UPI0036FDF8F7